MSKVIAFIIALIFLLSRRLNIKTSFFNELFNTDYDFNRFDDLFISESLKYGIDPKMTKAIALNESLAGFNRDKEKIGNTQNLMHVTLSTARQFDPSATLSNLSKDAYSLNMGLKFLEYLTKKYDGNEKLVVMAYNGGETRVNQFLDGSYKHSPKAVKAIENMTEYYERYKRNYKRLG